MNYHLMTLEQVQNLVLALVSNYPVPADKGAFEVRKGIVCGEYLLGKTVVHLEVQVAEEPDGRFTCQEVEAWVATKLLQNFSAIANVTAAFNSLESDLKRVLRSVRLLKD